MNAMMVSVNTMRDNCARKFADTHKPRTHDWKVLPHTETRDGKPRLVAAPIPTKK